MAQGNPVAGPRACAPITVLQWAPGRSKAWILRGLHAEWQNDDALPLRAKGTGVGQHLFSPDVRQCRIGSAAMGIAGTGLIAAPEDRVEVLVDGGAPVLGWGGAEEEDRRGAEGRREVGYAGVAADEQGGVGHEVREGRDCEGAGSGLDEVSGPR